MKESLNGPVQANRSSGIKTEIGIERKNKPTFRGNMCINIKIYTCFFVHIDDIKFLFFLFLVFSALIGSSGEAVVILLLQFLFFLLRHRYGYRFIDNQRHNHRYHVARNHINRERRRIHEREDGEHHSHHLPRPYRPPKKTSAVLSANAS